MHGDAAERCNGVDDDCDGATDETFECVQGIGAMGTNPCGREGVRRCGETCEWLDDGFFLAESSGTCDYCDDTGAGIDAELGFATGTFLEVIDNSDDLYGSATAVSFVDYVRVIDRSSAGVGSVFAPSRVAGHGSIVFDVDVNVSGLGSAPPGNGWALSILEASASTFLTAPTAAGGTGAPVDEEGLSVTWEFHTGTGTNDRVSLMRTSTTSSPRVLQTARPTFEFNDSTGTVRQRMRVLMTPDVVGTTEDETSILVQVERFGGGFAVEFYDLLECGPRAPRACGGFTLSPGTSYRFGVTAASSGTRRATVETRMGSSATVAADQVCP